MTAAPAPVRLFALLWAAQMLVTLVYQLLDPASVTGGLGAQSAYPGVAEPVVLSAIVLRLAISGLALWLVVWRQSNFGRWLAVLLALFRLRGTVMAIGLVAQGYLPAGLWLAGTVLAVAAAALLFRPAAKAWVGSDGAARR